MSLSRPPRAVLDSDIIYSRVLHELMGRVALRLGLLDLVWSHELLAEGKRVLMERKGLADEAAQRWVSYVPLNFPHGETDIGQALASAELGALTSDPGDRHVCALAIASGADYLFTHDRGYLRERLTEHGVEVTEPDSFLLTAFQDEPDGMLDLLELQASSWAGGQPIEELLDAIDRAGATRFAHAARRCLGT